MTALLFGSISTLADTSELQRESFNEAFTDAGLDWRWEGDEYRELLQSSGGKDRVAEYAKARGEDVDAAAVHQKKSELFQARLAQGGLEPRPGVADTIKAAKADGRKVAFVTTTAPENVSALLQNLVGVEEGDFDLIVDSSTVERPKPDAAAYTYALDQLGEAPGDAVAIEDNLGGVEAAKAAGVTVVAFPNANTSGHDFGKADKVADRLSLGDLPGA